MRDVSVVPANSLALLPDALVSDGGVVIVFCHTLLMAVYDLCLVCVCVVSVSGVHVRTVFCMAGLILDPRATPNFVLAWR